MFSHNTCIIVIPIYKEFEQLELTELASIKRAIQVFNKRNICFVGPQRLNVSPYLEFASIFSINILAKKLADDFFKNIDGYNQLLLSHIFYDTFSDFNYLLIYQPDCWVFKDELDMWCHKNYDFIGAPWINDDNLYKVINNNKKQLFELVIYLQKNLGLKKDWRVGNGGFSLHKISSSKRALKIFKKQLVNFRANEDMFWGIYVPLVLPFFKVPDVDEAMKFAFEMNPEQFYELNKRKLPFGCHAWHKYNFNFWKQWIHL